MKTIAFLVGVAMLAAASPVIAKSADKSPEAKLARALEGRVAEKPVDCVNLRDIRSTTIIDGTAIVYEGRGDTVYVNYPENGAESLDDWDVQVTDTQTSRLCSIDTVRLFDRQSNSLTGIVFLGEFVPYRKVAEDS